MSPRSEMEIPKSRDDAIPQGIFTIIVIFFTILGVFSIFTHVAIVASSIWLAIVAFGVWSACKDKGGLRNFLINRLGIFAPTQFVESLPRDTGPIEIRFGYQLLGHRFLYLSLPVDKIETLEWHTGQATSLAGRDMDDWHVVLWFDHDDPAKRKEWSLKPDQDFYIVGPSRKKEDTRAFGLSILQFLRDAGASLTIGKDDCTFVRVSSENENREYQKSISTPSD